MITPNVTAEPVKRVKRVMCEEARKIKRENESDPAHELLLDRQYSLP